MWWRRIFLRSACTHLVIGCLDCNALHSCKIWGTFGPQNSGFSDKKRPSPCNQFFFCNAMKKKFLSAGRTHLVIGCISTDVKFGLLSTDVKFWVRLVRKILAFFKKITLQPFFFCNAMKTKFLMRCAHTFGYWMLQHRCKIWIAQHWCKILGALGRLVRRILAFLKKGHLFFHCRPPLIPP